MLLQREKKKVPILMYHSISQYATPKFRQFAMPPRLFAEQMAYVQQHGYTPLTVTQFVKARTAATLPERPVVLTFDDGFADFFNEALPVFKRYGCTATLYIATSFVGGTSRWLRHEGETRRPMLTWEQIAEINACGIECGAHTHTHPQLDTISVSVAQHEIVQSKQLLEQHLGQEVLSFAYPFGYSTAHVRRLVREAGFTSACAVRNAMSSEMTDYFALARLIVKPDMCMETFAALLTGQQVSLVNTMIIRARTPVWQVARRSSASVTRYLPTRSKITDGREDT